MARTRKDLPYRLSKDDPKWHNTYSHEKKEYRKTHWKKFRGKNRRFSDKLRSTEPDVIDEVDPPIFKKTGGWLTW